MPVDPAPDRDEFPTCVVGQRGLVPVAICVREELICRAGPVRAPILERKREAAISILVHLPAKIRRELRK